MFAPGLAVESVTVTTGQLPNHNHTAPNDGFHLFTLNQADGSILTSVAVTGISGSYSFGGLAINPLTGQAYLEYSNLSGTSIASIDLTTGVTSSSFAISPNVGTLVDGLTFADDGTSPAPTPEPATALLVCIEPRP